MSIPPLNQLYELMAKTKTIRQRIVEHSLANIPHFEDTQVLKRTLSTLKKFPKENGHFLFTTGPTGNDSGKAIPSKDRQCVRIDLDYEIRELEKDISFLTEGEDALFREMEKGIPSFRQELEKIVKKLSSLKDILFITDRDGTVNNYCGRYNSSIQSAYNGVFLSRFAKKRCKRGIILTSAPLFGPGIIEMSVNAEQLFVYAGSKGREIRDEYGNVSSLPIDPDQQSVLDTFNKQLHALLDQPADTIFQLIGSGLQYKFGQTTIARQDANGSIPTEKSKAFLSSIRTLVHQIDPQGENLRIEDTGKDVEIMLTTKQQGKTKDFDKGDGLLFMEEKLGLDFPSHHTLICGDTGSDVPMLQRILEKLVNPEATPHTEENHSFGGEFPSSAIHKNRNDVHSNVSSVFVTREKELQQQVKKLLPDALFVSSPDVLVSALGTLGK